MSTPDNYASATSLDAYYPSRDVRIPARLWAKEKLLHDWSALGIVDFFEGAGDDPTVLSGYSVDKLWLRVSAGVTSSSGTIRYYKGGTASLLASWPELTRAGFADHIGVRQGDLDYRWSTGTSGDPGSGYVGGNNTTLSAITELRISKTGRLGASNGAEIVTWDDSAAVLDKGVITIYGVADNDGYVHFTVTGALTDNTTYYSIPVSVRRVGGGTLVADQLLGAKFVASGYVATAIKTVSTIAAMKALTAANYELVYLSDTDRSGEFIWSSANNAANVTADPANAIYVPPNSDATGASGAWVRVHDDAVKVNWWGFSTSNAKADNNVAMNRFIAWFNAESRVTASINPGIYQVAGAFDTITGSEKSIVCAPRSVFLTKDDTETQGQFFKIGDGGSTTTVRITVSGIDFRMLATSGVSGFVWEIDGASDVNIETMRYVSVGGLIRVGNTTLCSRVWMDDFRGTYNDTNNHIIGEFIRWTGLRLSRGVMYGNDTKGSAMTVPVFRFPVVGECDTVRFDSVEVWTESSSPQWMLVDCTKGTAVNGWISDCVGDKCGTGSAAIILRSLSSGNTSSGSDQWRIVNWNFARNRHDTGGDSPGGSGVQFIQQMAAGNTYIRNIVFSECWFTYRDSAAVVLPASSGDELQNISFRGCQFQEAASSSISDVMQIGANYVSVTNCSFGFAERPSSSHTTNAIKTTADVTNLIVSDNILRAPTVLVSHFASATAAAKATHQISGSEHVAQKIGATPTTGTISAGVLAATSSSMAVAGQGGLADDLTDISGGFDGMQLTLRASDTAVTITCKDSTGSAGTQLFLSGDMALDNYTDSITLQYVSLLQGWIELARSNNGA